jgi:hypothetical protein
MLHSYAFSNFRSFRSRVEVSLVLNEKDSVNGWDVTSSAGQRLTTAMAVLGANASGKTSLLQPLAFLAWFVPYSFNDKPTATIPVSPHFTNADEPTEFELVVDAIAPETLWRYRLSLTEQHVIAESLERKLGRGRWQRIFERQLNSDGGYEVRQSDFGLDPTQAAAVRSNVSLISWAVQFGVPLAKQLCEIMVLTNINSSGRMQARADSIGGLAEQYAEDKLLQEKIRLLLRGWDLGLEDVVARDIEIPDRTGKTQAEKIWVLLGVHSSHGKHYVLPFGEESSGTQAAFSLLARFLPALENGGFIVYDELDSDLHPLMLGPLLALFSDPKINKNHAQIVFTCHSAEVLRYLQKTQVVLVEKNSLESRAWRLDSMSGVRSDDNRVAKYLSGAYGAIPRFSKAKAHK